MRTLAERQKSPLTWCSSGRPGRADHKSVRLKNPHLTAAVRLFFSRQFTVKIFPYMEALKAWRAAAANRGRYTGTGHK